MLSNLLPEIQLAREPNRILITVDPLDDLDTNLMAERAVNIARSLMPKVTGYMVSTLRPMHSINYFGIYFPDRRVWFQEQGTRPFTMRSLAGKTIPMWVENPSEDEKRNPKTKRRTTVDGRTQYLIFRRAALPGQTRQVVRRVSGGGTRIARVPMSYPGAPGRIVKREAKKPLTSLGRTGGRIASGNVGVRWRHPGISGRQFLNVALTQSADEMGLEVPALYLADDVTFFALVRL